MEFYKIGNTKLELGFRKLLQMSDRKARIEGIEKLTKTKIIIENNNVFIIWLK